MHYTHSISSCSTAKAIKLYWDESIGAYTATVSDHNGVLNYFDE